MDGFASRRTVDELEKNVRKKNIRQN